MKSSESSPRPGPCAETSFRLRLQTELARRCSRSPRYSLRALALDLDVDHSTLSQLLRGKRRLTRETVERLGAKLGLTRDSIAHYVEQEERWSAAGEPGARAVAELAQDAAAVVADWHHFAILELLHLEGFQPDARWIARVLDLPVDEIAIALQRLLRLRMLEMVGPGRWVDRCGDAVADIAAFPQAALRRLFEQASALAAGAVRRAGPGASHQSATTLAIDRARLPEALARIERLRSELAELLAGGARRDDVYRLELSLYPITRLDDDEKE